MVVYAGIITVEIGASAEDKEDVTNIESVVYREVPQPNIKPITVMNSVPPVGWHTGHRWVEGEIHVKSEAYEAIHNNGSGPVDYLPTTRTAPIACPHLLIKLLTTAGAGWTATILGAKFYSEEHIGGHDVEGITIYKFVAASVSLVAD